VCLASWPGLHRLIKELRDDFPAVKLCLEVKSPVIMRNAEKRAQNTAQWRRVQQCIDAIIAPSRGMAETYLAAFDRPFMQHRSIIDYSKIEKRSLELDRVACRRFVFSGSIARLRQIDKLLVLISQLPPAVLRTIQIDFFGDGDVRGELESLAAQLGLRETVRFMGAIPQAELFRIYKNYDAGIAWVPKELYDSAPSLKLIEYCASGIVPLATSSKGHQLLNTYGFHVEYFDEDDGQSFVELMTRVCADGADAHALRENVRQARSFDFRSVIGNEILPFYRSLDAEKQRPGGLVTAGPVGAGRDLQLTLRESVDAWRMQAACDAALDLRDLAHKGGIAYERALHARRMLAGVKGFGWRT